MNTPEQKEKLLPKTSSRRRLFTTLFGGGAVAAIPTLAATRGNAAGTDYDTVAPEVMDSDTVAPEVMEMSTVDNARTTNVATPPLQPTDADKKILNVALGVELAIRDLYADIVAAGELNDEELSVILLIHSHHVSYAQSLGGLLGRASISDRNEITYDEYAEKIKGSFNQIAPELVVIENRATKLHITSLQLLEGLNGAALIASIISIESRHAASLASLMKNSLSAIIENNQSPIPTGA